MFPSKTAEIQSLPCSVVPLGVPALLLLLSLVAAFLAPLTPGSQRNLGAAATPAQSGRELRLGACPTRGCSSSGSDLLSQRGSAHFPCKGPELNTVPRALRHPARLKPRLPAWELQSSVRAGGRNTVPCQAGLRPPRGSPVSITAGDSVLLP